MGSLNSFFESISKRINQRKEKNHNYFKRMKRGLNESLDDIRQTFKPIKNWEELMELNPDEDSDEEKEKEDSKENPNMNLRKSKTTLNRPTVSKFLNVFYFALIYVKILFIAVVVYYSALSADGFLQFCN